jgi:filamentous hemagglutinin family protein
MASEHFPSIAGDWQRGALHPHCRTPLAHIALLMFALSGAGVAQAVGTGTIAAGQGTITTSGAATAIEQASDRMIINWNNFDIGKGEAVNIIQPSVQAAVLNRVTGGDPTSILGKLNANGRVFIVNPNGITIGGGAQINVGGLIASSLNISNKEFMKASAQSGWRFAGGGKGGVQNSGRIDANEMAVLIGHKVFNYGVVNGGHAEADFLPGMPHSGDVALAAADGATVMLRGPSSVEDRFDVRLDKSVRDAQVLNYGEIDTPNGDTHLVAAAKGGKPGAAPIIVNEGGVVAGNALNKHYFLGDGGIVVRASGGDAKLGGALAATRTNIAADNVDMRTGWTVIDGGYLSIHSPGQVHTAAMDVVNGSVAIAGRGVSLGGDIDGHVTALDIQAGDGGIRLNDAYIEARGEHVKLTSQGSITQDDDGVIETERLTLNGLGTHHLLGRENTVARVDGYVGSLEVANGTVVQGMLDNQKVSLNIE